MISRELFDRVQAILDDHRTAKERQRVHHHYLKGSLFCGKCGSRMCFSKFRGHGGEYFYFFCLGRQRRNGCPQRHLRRHDVEEAVEEYFREIVLKPNEAEALRFRVRRDLAGARKRAQRDLTHQRARLDKLAKERRELLELFYEDSMPRELLVGEQRRITREEDEARRLIAAAEGAYAEVENTILAAIAILENCHAVYRRGNADVRRRLAQGIFECLWVDEVEGPTADLRPMFAELLREDFADRLQYEVSGSALAERGIPESDGVAVGQGLSTTQMVPPALLDTNTPPVVPGPAVQLAPCHAKVRRDGDRRSA